jgi:hypothetical protein
VLVLLAFLLGSAAASYSQAASAPPELLRPNPGKAVAASNGTSLSLGNSALAAAWTTEHGKFKFTKFHDLLGNQTLVVPGEVFVLRLQDGSELPATALSVVSSPGSLPKIEELRANPTASRLSDRLAGKKIVVTLRAPSENIEVIWSGILRDGSNYLRQEITLRALGHDVSVSEIRLIAWRLPQAKVIGTVPG